MKQGAARHALADRKDDLYETPQEATLALIRNVSLPHFIWEPAAGRGAISRELKKAGHSVAATDLNHHDGADSSVTHGVDFLMERDAGANDAIVTNPPYKLADQFIRHGLSLGLRTIVLLRLMAIEGAGRSDIIDTHCTRIWAGIERLPMLHREGWEGPKIKASGMPYAWFEFTPEPRARAGIELHRISWRLA